MFLGFFLSLSFSIALFAVNCERWIETHSAGAAFSSVPLVFSHDGKYYFAAVGASVKCVSVATCEVVRTLQVADTVRGVGISADNVAQLVTTSVDGFVRYWDYDDGVLLHEYDVGVQIEASTLHRSLGNVLFVLSSSRYAAPPASSSSAATSPRAARSIRRHTADDGAIDDHRHDAAAHDDEHDDDNAAATATAAAAADDDDDAIADAPPRGKATRSRSARARSSNGAGVGDDNNDDAATTVTGDDALSASGGGGSGAAGGATVLRQIVKHRDRLWRVLRCEFKRDDENNTTTSADSHNTKINVVVDSQTLFKVRHGSALSLSADSRHIVCLAGSIVKLYDTHQRMLRSFQSKITVSSVAVSPSLVDGIVAFGDISGRISLWRCLAADTCALPQSKCLVTSLHWHAHAVNALQFNSDGDYLYSGGNEGVLVSWQLRSGARTFLPRLVCISREEEENFISRRYLLNFHIHKSFWFVRFFCFCL